MVCGPEILRYKPQDLPPNSAPPASSFSTHHLLQSPQQFHDFETRQPQSTIMYIQALIVAALSASASAANCWPSVTNGIYTSDVGVQLAWNLRSTLCLNYWNSNTRVQTYHGADWGDCGTNWKGAGSSFCWGGYFVSGCSSQI